MIILMFFNLKSDMIRLDKIRKRKYKWKYEKQN